MEILYSSNSLNEGILCEMFLFLLMRSNKVKRNLCCILVAAEISKFQHIKSKLPSTSSLFFLRVNFIHIKT